LSEIIPWTDEDIAFLVSDCTKLTECVATEKDLREMSDLKMDILELQPIPGTKENIDKLDDELKSISEKLGPIIDLLSV